MLYRPSPPRKLWDTWLLEWQGTFHLFYLETEQELWDHVGHAVSEDLVHWTPRPSILTRGQAGRWNEGPTLTGMVVHHQGRFYMFVGASHNSVQRVGVYTSDDLDKWVPYPGNPVMRPQGPHYLAEPAPPQFPSVDWRDPCITYREEDACYHALLCGRLPHRSHQHSGAVVAHVRSRDLIHWEHLPPIDAPTGRFYHTEVPDIFELEGKYYLLFSTLTLGGIRLDTTSRDDAVGTFYMVNDGIDGPFTLLDDYLLIGAGQGKMASYVGRTIPYGDGRLLYHHIQAARPAWGSPKMIARHDDDSLYLQYMPLLERLETGIVCQPADKTACFEVDDLGEWLQREGLIVGRAAALGSACTIARNVGDLHFSCQVNSSSGARCGIVLRSHEASGVLIALDYERQRLEIGKVRYSPLAGWGNGGSYQDVCRYKLQHGKSYHLRCYARDEHFEVYLDDSWVFTTVMAEAAKSGDVELAVERSRAEFSEIRVAAIEPLP